MRDMIGLLKNLLALQALLSNHLTFIKPQTPKTNRCVFKFDRICKSCNFLAKMVWSIEMMILVSTEICQKLMLRRFPEGFGPGKTFFFDDVIFCVQIFAHLRWFKLQMTWANYSELSPGHSQW